MRRAAEPAEREYLRLVGRRVLIARSIAGLSQLELAARSGVHNSTLSRLEAGEHAGSVLTFLKLSRSLGVWMGALLDEELPPKPRSTGPDRAEGLPS